MKHYLLGLLQNTTTQGRLEDIFGGGVTSVPYADKAVNEGLSDLFVFSIDLVFFIAALTVLTYMLWGAFNYISAGGEKDKIEKARGKIIGAAIGAILLVVTLTFWMMISRNILGVLKGDKIEFELPTLRESSSSGTGQQGSGDSQPK